MCSYEVASVILYKKMRRVGRQIMLHRSILKVANARERWPATPT
jgi:hypothetical protein